jgi:SpoVK/Ycf46/Vps4 family AAA+-type ATPase
MENDRDRLVVIVAGYPEKMRHFLQSNPGVARRFPIENHYDFSDFSPEELSQILQRLLADRSIPVEEEMQKSLTEIVQGLYLARDETFGNAGEMRNLCEAIDRRRAVRILHQQAPYDSVLQIEDLPDQYRSYLAPQVPDIDRLLENLEELVGLHTVKGSLRRMAHRLELEHLRRQQSLGKAYTSPMQHLVFTGNPGTGKTTIARLIGRMYRSLGLLKKGHVVEVSRHDLVAGYVGQTAIKTMDRVKAALDGVLFVDEAYSLIGGGANDFGQEAIDTLVKAMEDYRDRLVVIAAGYPQEMQEFLTSNPGLRSRFSQPLPFPDYELPEMSEILERLALRDGYILTKNVIDRVLVHLDQMRAGDARSFGNARTVQTMFECMKDSLAERVLSDKSTVYTAEQLSTFLVDDVPVPAGSVPIPELSFEPLPVEIVYQPRRRSKPRTKRN